MRLEEVFLPFTKKLRSYYFCQRFTFTMGLPSGEATVFRLKDEDARRVKNKWTSRGRIKSKKEEAFVSI